MSASSRFTSATQQRTQLFSAPVSYNPSRTHTPYSETVSRSSYESTSAGVNAGASASASAGAPPVKYTERMLRDLEDQNDSQVDGLMSKVAQLKGLTNQIGDEIRDSSKFLSSLEENFENAGTRLKGTFRRMMIMADHAGVGWRAWLAVFCLVFLAFWFVWWR